MDQAGHKLTTHTINVPMLFTATQLSHLTASVYTARLIVEKVHIKRCFTPKKFHFHCRHFSQIIDQKKFTIALQSNTQTPTDPLHISFDHQEIASFEVSSMTQKNTWSHYCMKNIKVLSEIPNPRALLVQSTSSRQYFIARSAVTRHVGWTVELLQAWFPFSSSYITVHHRALVGQCCHSAACLCHTNRGENHISLESQSSKRFIWLGP